MAADHTSAVFTGPLPTAVRQPNRGSRIGAADSRYGELADFLADEAALLDEDRFADWMKIIASDMFYWIPVRQTVHRRSGMGFDSAMAYLYETHASLKMRVARMIEFENAHSEDPPSRTRRFITNVRIYETEKASETAVDVSLLVTRSRGDSNKFQLLSGKRQDLLRKTANGWQLFQRVVLLDQSVLETPNFGIFL
jgi:3-phenylpropionate/cinnamic acid dioxygenase small subunit